MPSKVSVIAVNWHGPFDTIQSAGAEAHSNGVSQGLYLAVSSSTKAYSGISRNIKSRLNKNHHVLGNLRAGEAKIWVGVVVSQGIRTDQGSINSRSITLAEKMTAFFLQLSENINLKSVPPKESVVLLNRWYEATLPHGRLSKRGHPDWPDMIEFDNDLGEAQIIWFGKLRMRLSRDEVINWPNEIPA